jgi:demethylmenaquinone methyltransferase / 2-methoxy-6-polyprenyl-1,4-benzoquinol methylase
MTERIAFPKGTQPEGAQDPQEASRRVREMFTRIAPRYDLLNHLLSAQMDRLWRARAARELAPILQRPGAVVLDLCCGTGDLAFALQRKAKARILGADFSHTMLVRACEKSHAAKANGTAPIPFLEADALHLPFADRSFDLVTSAFGFRNLASYEDGLKEILRVLKPDGSIAILEFAEPPPGFLGDAYRFYTRTMLPKIGAMISGDSEAYAYLPKSVARFFRPEELASTMNAAGYKQVRFHLMTLGSVALHMALRPPTEPATNL